MKRLLILCLLLAYPVFGQITTLPGGGGSFASGDADGDIQDVSPLVCVDAGANDTYTCTMSPVPASAAAAPLIWFNPNTANTGAATLDIGPGSALAIYKHSDGTALADNDLRADVPVLLTYCAACNSAAGAWILGALGNAPAAADDQTAAEVPFTPAGGVAATDTQAAIEEVDSEKTTAAAALTAANAAIQGAEAVKCTDAGANDTYTCTMSPVPSAASDVDFIWFDPNTSNTGAATLDIGPGSALPIYQNIDGVNPDDNDLVANTPVLLRYCAACNSAAGAWVFDDLRGASLNIEASSACPTEGVLLTGSDGLTTCIPPSVGVLEFFIANPVVGATSAVQKALPNFAANTATAVFCSCVGASCTVDLNFDARARTTPSSAGTDLDTSEFVADEDGVSDTSFAGDSAAAANEVWNLSISAITNAPTLLRCYLTVEPN